METFDVVVIGGGPGGYPAAIRAAQRGARVAVVEKESLGGTCLNWGCIPTKTLIAASSLYWQARHGAAMGVKADGLGFDYAAMARRKDDVVAKLRGGVAALLKGNGVTVFAGTGSFETRNRIAVTEASGARTVIGAARTILATGSESAVPKFLPQSPRVVESRRFLDLTALPASLIVLGGGVIGCEFACMAAQLGVKVTVVEMLEDILMILDADVRRELRKHMEGELGIRVLTGKPLEKIAADAAGVSGVCGEEALRGDLLLVSVGRRPVTAGLDLERAGLKVADNGCLPVDDFCRTAAATVYAIGDVTGRSQLAHAATSQGLTAAEQATGLTKSRAESLVPACIFTAPEIGSVGLTEQQAKQAGIATHVGKFAFSGLGKALAANEPGGFIKWVADAGTGRMLGAHAIGAHATELIAEATLAIRAELTLDEVGRTVHCHPTFSEAWMEAAHAAHGTCIHAPPRKR